MSVALKDNAGSGKTAKSDQQVLLSRDDREMILRKHIWPNKINLPLKNVKRPEKRSIPFDNMGFLLASDASLPLTVYVGLIFQPIEDLPSETYNTVDEMIADGWIVD